MLNPTLEKLTALRLKGMVRALKDQMQQPDIEALSFEERLSLLIEVEANERENNRLKTRLRQAKLKQAASIENIDYSKSRGFNRSFILKLSICEWIKSHNNLLIVGATGTGKSYFACALAHKACLNGFTAYYSRLPRLLQDLSIARGDGRYTKLMNNLAKLNVLILDDWGISGLNAEQRRDLLELLDDRYEKQSTIVTSQLPVNAWHESINDNTLADAILDRLVHNAYRLELKGDSMRKTRAIKNNA